MGTFKKKTVKDIKLTGKTVLLRADYNVPIAKGGKISDDYRMKESVPTVQYLLKQRCKVVICSHLGRPKVPGDTQFSLKPVAAHLEKLLKHPVKFVGSCVGPEAEAAVQAAKTGDVLLLENLRFHKEEEANDQSFAAELAKLADVFVQDGFAVVHREHASTSAITKKLPSVAGLLLEKEVSTLNEVMENPKRPLMAVMGGAKIADKIAFIKRFIELADVVVVAGAIANTFLVAQGKKIGKSLVDKDDISLAKDLLDKAEAKEKKEAFSFYLPRDGVVATKIDSTAKTRIVDWDVQLIADIQNYPKKPEREAGVVAADEMILDIGPLSASFIAGAMQSVATVVWNGTMGITETPPIQSTSGPFAHGTELIVDAMLGQFGHKPYTVVGGGDTVGYLEARRLTDHFDHISTGGGASLELMSGRKLPGVEALQNK